MRQSSQGDHKQEIVMDKETEAELMWFLTGNFMLTNLINRYILFYHPRT